MAKSKKKVSKKKEVAQTKKSDSSGQVVAVLVVLAIIGAVIFYFAGGKSISIERGQCYMDRSYKPLIVDTVWRSLGDVWFHEAEVREIEGSGWYLAKAGNRYSFDRERKVDFVKENYTLIPCENLRVRD